MSTHSPRSHAASRTRSWATDSIPVSRFIRTAKAGTGEPGAVTISRLSLPAGECRSPHAQSRPLRVGRRCLTTFWSEAVAIATLELQNALERSWDDSSPPTVETGHGGPPQFTEWPTLVEDTCHAARGGDPGHGEAGPLTEKRSASAIPPFRKRHTRKPPPDGNLFRLRIRMLHKACANWPRV